MRILKMGLVFGALIPLLRWNGDTSLNNEKYLELHSRGPADTHVDYLHM